MSLVAFKGIGAPFYRHEVDTDMIIPSFRVQDVDRNNLGEALFGGLRYYGKGMQKRPDFLLNKEPFNQAVFLITGRHFGCGSSRETAVWALQEFGFRCIVAPSFGSVFYRNCIYNGLIPVILPHLCLEQLILRHMVPELEIDLESSVLTVSKEKYHFDMSSFYKNMLLHSHSVLQVSQALTKDTQAFESKRVPT